jgi:phosphoribosylanthranilate isomerase
LKTWIKFCGTTSVEDALASIEAGADALGFIFAPSKRRVTPEKAREIIRQLPGGTERIGVFVNQAADHIWKVVGEVDLSGVQLHGGEDAGDIYRGLPEERRDSVRIVSTVLVDQSLSSVFQGDVAAPGLLGCWLLDSGAGSGRTFDWHRAHMELGKREGRFIIAGGLNPENVGEAIRIFSPWGVDVVSGIEREPGRKDREKMHAFVDAVRKAEQQ